ncbi:Ig-like domain-containing protein [Exiguobacterium sp. s192]|uniref:Ig-like domain-containing protein n=1 Tax=Exiguobacterium sp. s192 TaxID=2751206 RepID=UPI001BECF76A|nr:Ig-like domain-containing protein [Exiguobacterium sp. s192]
MKRILAIFLLTIIATCLHVTTGYAEEHPSILPFKMESKIIEGNARAGEQLYVYAKGEFHLIKVDNQGKFKLELSEKVGESNVILYLKDKWGYDSQEVMYQAIDLTAPPEVRTKNTVTFIGLTANNEFYLTTTPGTVIYATYEGKVYSGQDKIFIPRGNTTQIKAYAKGQDGVKGETVTLLTTSNAEIKIETYDYHTNLLKGHAWPYAVLEFRNGAEYMTSIEADQNGNFEFSWSPSVEVIQQENTISVEGLGLPVSINSQKSIEPFTPSKATPFYMFMDVDRSLVGVTFPNVQVQIDGVTCTISDNAGYFACTLPEKNEPVRDVSFRLNGEVVGSTFVESEARLEEFPLKLDQPVTSEHPVFSGTTLPNRTFKLEYGWGGLEIKSNENGKFFVNLPRKYRGNLSLSIVSSNKKLVFLKTWMIEDARPLLKPDMKIINEDLVLTNHMPGFSKLYGEIVLEHANGEIDIEKITFDNTYSFTETSTAIVKNIQEGDRYSLRIFTNTDDREVKIEGLLHPVKKAIIDSFESTDKVLTGTVEPNSTVELEAWVIGRGWKNQLSFKGVANSEGKVVLKSTGLTDGTIIDMSIPVRITISRKNSLDRNSYNQMFIDESPADLTVSPIKNTDYYVGMKANDSLQKIEIEYYKNQTLVNTSEKEAYGAAYVTISYDEPGNGGERMFIKDGITHILVRATNSSGLVSDWKEVKVLSTKIPTLTSNEIYYGDRTVEVTTNPNTIVQMKSDKETSTAKADAKGKAIIKLKYPITVRDNQVMFIVRSEAGNEGYIYKRPIGYPVEDIQINETKDKMWFVTKDKRLKIKNYELKINGQKVELQTTSSNPRSVLKLPKALKMPVTVELTLKNSNKTTKSYYKKTIKTVYQNKKVSNVITATKDRMIQGVAQPYHEIEFIDQDKMNLTSVILYENPKFKVKSNRPLRIGQLLTMVSKNPFGQKIITQVKIKDDVAPNVPTVSKVTTSSKYVTGKTEKNARVSITYKKKVYTTIADSKGVYRLKIQSWRYKEKVEIYAKDAAGNKSQTISTTVQR